MELSRQIEEYLEAIYRKEKKGENATTKEIAKELNITEASVSEMLRKLAKNGFIEHTPYGHAILTVKGKEIGKNILRKHRIIEKFLTLIGVKRKIHEEACKLEHVVSDDVEKRVRNVVLKAELKKIPLTLLENGEQGKIVEIKNGAKASQRLAALGLTKDTIITFTKSAPFSGPVKIIVRGTMLALGRGIAMKIFVKRV